MRTLRRRGLGSVAYQYSVVSCTACPDRRRQTRSDCRWRRHPSATWMACLVKGRGKEGDCSWSREFFVKHLVSRSRGLVNGPLPIGRYGFALGSRIGCGRTCGLVTAAIYVGSFVRLERLVFGCFCLYSRGTTRQQVHVRIHVKLEVSVIDTVLYLTTVLTTIQTSSLG